MDQRPLVSFVPGTRVDLIFIMRLLYVERVTCWLTRLPAAVMMTTRDARHVNIVGQV